MTPSQFDLCRQHRPHVRSGVIWGAISALEPYVRRNWAADVISWTR